MLHVILKKYLLQSLKKSLSRGSYLLGSYLLKKKFTGLKKNLS